MMLTNDAHRGALFYNTWVPLVLLQVNTVVVSLQLESTEERFESNLLLIEQFILEKETFWPGFSYIVPVFRRR